MSADSADLGCGHGGRQACEIKATSRGHGWPHQSPGRHSPVDESCFTSLKQRLVLGVPSALWSCLITVSALPTVGTGTPPCG